MMPSLPVELCPPHRGYLTQGARLLALPAAPLRIQQGVVTRPGIKRQDALKRPPQVEILVTPKMADTAALAPAAPAKKVAKAPKAASKPKTAPASHPSYADMIKKAITESKEKNGCSKAALLKYICSHFKVGDNILKVNAQLRLALKRGVANKSLNQIKGTGASGSFKLGEKKAVAAKKVAKMPTTKKPSAEKKAKSPKKSIKPKAKTTKKAASTKKTKKAATKVKKPAAKKTAAPAAVKA